MWDVLGRGEVWKSRLVKRRARLRVQRTWNRNGFQDLSAEAETVLVAENGPLLREMLRETLESAGYEVLAASDGAEALQLANEHAAAIQLLITDIVMPGFTGVRLAKQLAPAREPRYSGTLRDGQVPSSASRPPPTSPCARFARPSIAPDSPPSQGVAGRPRQISLGEQTQGPRHLGGTIAKHHERCRVQPRRRRTRIRPPCPGGTRTGTLRRGARWHVRSGSRRHLP